MDVVTVTIKLLLIIVFSVLPVIPLILEYIQFKRDVKKGISSKRLRLLVFLIIYVIILTVLFMLQRDILDWIASLSFVQWLASKLAVLSRIFYCVSIFAAIIINTAIGLVYRILQHTFRIGLKNSNIAVPAGKDGEFTLLQRIERKIIFFFRHEIYFMLGKILLGVSFGLTVTYSVLLILFQLPAFFSADWIPYAALQMAFGAGNVYFILTLLLLWSVSLFLRGLCNLEKECPELFADRDDNTTDGEIDLDAIDRACRKEYDSFFVGSLNLSDKSASGMSPVGGQKNGSALIGDMINTRTGNNAGARVALSSDGDFILQNDDAEIAECIARAIENDERFPKKNVDLYTKCIARLLENEDTCFIINGSFYSDFSVYLFRYLSMIVARGDNIVIICNSIHEVERMNKYVTDGFSLISSLYCKSSKKNIRFDDPIWKIRKITKEEDMAKRTQMLDASVIITTLPFLCSKPFEYFSGSFIQLLDTVIFSDVLETINRYSDLLSAMNLRFLNIIENSSRKSKSSEYNPKFRIRYKSMPIRYIAFDDSRIPGLDKALKNFLSVNFESFDIMTNNENIMVRLYNNEPQPNENGKLIFPNILNTSEKLGNVINMAVVAARAGARDVRIYEGGGVPFENYRESLAANTGRLTDIYENVSITINDRSYMGNNDAVVIVYDEKSNLPETLRRYISLFGDDKILLMVLSKNYLFRDYYVDNIDKIWQGCQYSRIPEYEITVRDIARKILLKADSGGITVKQIYDLCQNIRIFQSDLEQDDINSILRKVLEVFGVSQRDYINIYDYFEYSHFGEFDDKGYFDPVDKISLRHTGQYYDIVNGLDMARIYVNGNEYMLPLSRMRISQNYISGQNMIYEGNIYKIDKIRTEIGRIEARLASGGNNDEAVEYIQDRKYIVYMSEDSIINEKSKHIVITKSDIDSEPDISVRDVYINVLSFPMEVITRGYYIIDPYTMKLEPRNTRYVNIFEGVSEKICKHTYRKYGYIEKPFYTTDEIVGESELNAYEGNAKGLSLKLKGSFGGNSDRMLALAGVMLNEILKMIYPSIADCIAVCPIYHDRDKIAAEGRGVLDFYPEIDLIGGDVYSDDEIWLLIIEDCASDVGLLYSLTESGDDILNTLFKPIRDYLEWYVNSVDGSNYLYFGGESLPECFDIDSLLKLSECMTGSDIQFRNTVSDNKQEMESCDFCRRRLPKSMNDIIKGKDGRVMCSKCRQSVVGNDKEKLSELVAKARMFIESTYGIAAETGDNISFESTKKVEEMIKNGKVVYHRGDDLPLMSFIDGSKHIFIEYDIPEVNILELIVRGLVQLWQINEVPDANAELAEGHIAFVTIQLLSFIGKRDIYRSMLSYYESTKNISGMGYRALIKLLASTGGYRDNPFFLLMSSDGREINIPKRKIAGEGDYGESYKPEVPDRCAPEELRYYYYDNIPEKLRVYYNTLLDAVKEFKEFVEFTGVETDDIRNAMKALKNDHPELFWLRQITEFYYTGDTVSAHIEYSADKEESERLQERIDEAVKPFLDGITPEMSAYDVLVRLHVKMINYVDYDTVGLRREKRSGGLKDEEIDSLRTICGALLEGKAVCAGYARAMQYLANLCGIECTYCLGRCHSDGKIDGEYHAWNIVKLDGDYYHLDTTWCDQSNTVQTIKKTEIGFDYFCVTTDEITRSRDIDMEPIEIPNYRNNKCNYYIHNGLVIESYDPGKIIEMAEHFVRNGKKYVRFKCSSRSVYNETMDRLFKTGNDSWNVVRAAAAIDNSIRSDHHTYNYNDEILTISINFG